MLQQAPAAAKLQLLEERGTLLLQLLYEVMLDDDSGRSRHAGVNTNTIQEYSSKQAGVLLRELAAARAPEQDHEVTSSSAAPAVGSSSSSSGSDSSSSSSSDSFEAGRAKPVTLVLLVLQSLLYEAVPLAAVGGMPLQLGRMLAIGE